MTGPQFKGLSIYNTWFRKLTPITDEEGAGADPVIDQDGNIVFRVTTYERGRKVTAHKLYSSGSKNTPPVDYTAPAEEIEVMVKGKELEILKNGATIKTIQPAGERYYVWPSLSPDKSKLLFTAVGDGTYITDLDGNILTRLEKLNAPQWMNNKWVMGMDDEDDGHMTTSSDVIVVHVTSGKHFNLTIESEEIATYPKASSKSSKIVFHNPKGEVFTLKIKLKE
ncbi:MAG: hypothetical protein ABFS10_07465 [Bacteroidota bacterium]